MFFLYILCVREGFILCTGRELLKINEEVGHDGIHLGVQFQHLGGRGRQFLSQPVYGASSKTARAHRKTPSQNNNSNKTPKQKQKTEMKVGGLSFLMHLRQQRWR